MIVSQRFLFLCDRDRIQKSIFGKNKLLQNRIYSSTKWCYLVCYGILTQLTNNTTVSRCYMLY